MSVQPTGASEANAAFKAGGVEVSALGLVVITTGVCVCYLATQAVFLFRGGSLSASRTEFNVGVNPQGRRGEVQNWRPSLILLKRATEALNAGRVVAQPDAWTHTGCVRVAT